MTAHKHFKHLVRERMGKTGETYTAARRHIIQQVEIGKADEGPARWHLPGNVPATTALRICLTAAGVRDPRTGQPLTEAMLFGLCGGIGAGVASFFYEKADFSSFQITGRHLWFDDLAYLRAALDRLGIKPIVRESSGAKGAEKQLREMLADGKPVIAWANGYRVITVYGIDDAKAEAIIGDQTDEARSVSLSHLASDRGAIKAFKNRLLAVPPTKVDLNLSQQVAEGLRACHAGLRRPPEASGALVMSGLESFEKWAANLKPAPKKESWSRAFPRGHRLWMGLTFIHDFIESIRTGGGLCRPLFAEFLAEAAALPGWKKLGPLAGHYAQIGADWTDLAHAALPQELPAFREVRDLFACRNESRTSGEPENGKPDSITTRLEALQQKARREFPLSEARCSELLETLHVKATALYHAESNAHAALGELLK